MIKKHHFSLASISLLLCGVLSILGLIFPAKISKTLLTYTQDSMALMDNLFLIICSFFIILCVALAISPWGRIRLGYERPEFSRIAWLAMLFAAGMGSGICFWGVAEPLVHTVAGPTALKAESQEAINFAFAITHFHWGFHAWGIYAINALCLAFFAFNRGGKLLASTPFKTCLPKHLGFYLGNLADILAILAIVFGVAGSLGMGSRQIGSGIKLLFLQNSSVASITLVVLFLMTVVYLFSASTTLNRGIKILSNLNLSIAILLMLFILAFGPTTYILKNLWSGTASYLQNLLPLSSALIKKDGNSDWSYSWTMTYLIWWVAWTPFVGIFIARISKGRTIREFMLGILLIPTIFSIVWFSVFGSSGIYLQKFTSMDLSQTVVNKPASILFEVLTYFPWSKVVSIVAMLLLFIFLVTSADSASYVLGMMTSKGSLNPKKRKKILWGIIIASMTTSAIFAGGDIHIMKAMAISGAIPFFIIMLLQTVLLLKEIPKKESIKEE